MRTEEWLDFPYEWDCFWRMGECLAKREASEERIQEEIQAFSYYIRSRDQNYYYNETFLPLFTDDFLGFIKSFYRKYPSVKCLFSAVKREKGLEIVIDRYWKCEITDLIYKCSVYENPNWEWVNKDELRIECIYRTGARRYLLHRELPLESNFEKIYSMSEEIGAFIEKHTKGESADGSELVGGEFLL